MSSNGGPHVASIDTGAPQASGRVAISRASACRSLPPFFVVVGAKSHFSAAARSRPLAEGCNSRELIAGPSARLRAELDMHALARRAGASPRFRPACRIRSCVPSQAPTRTVSCAAMAARSGGQTPFFTQVADGPPLFLRRRVGNAADFSYLCVNIPIYKKPHLWSSKEPSTKSCP